MTETLVFNVPTELKDVIVSVVNQILSINPQTHSDAAAADAKGFQPPSYDEVYSYCRQTNSRVNPGRFFNWMKDHDWIDGRGEPITDWKGKLSEWEQRETQMNPRQRVRQKSTLPGMPTPSYKDDLGRLEKMLASKEGTSTPADSYSDLDMLAKKLLSKEENDK